ncbi:LamG domain-containing protein [Sulfitobacter dubius]|uniref:Concanavalin A-like lectin/glucanases superfamily protein n=1 Tax=Sulfitobacter dubius TaxID=218673 RepID=A0ABY3ZJ25_9RHOB|nr:LamG domain-containing protein [Sulfitobacter dubius]UOA14538.1 hypothetical protein DSM109990_01344 [Sulfitobacter dubius]
MAIQKQVIMGRLYQASGEPIGAGFVRFTLNRFDATDNGVIAASRKIEAEIETDGSVAVELWPNTAGDRGTFYTVTLLGEAGNELEKYGRINIGTDGPYQLADLLREEMPPAATSYWMSLTEAEFAAKVAQMDARVSTAETARDIALTARDTTIAARDAAEGSKNAAYGYAQDVASAIVYQNLAGVLASYGLNIVDAFVYDTTRDFMAGLWRYRCKDKTWYDEAGAATGRWLGGGLTYGEALSAGGQIGDYYLNQNGTFYRLTDGSHVLVYRGSRREFPANAIITAEAGRVVIWDGDDPSLPMWRAFPKPNVRNFPFWWDNGGTYTVTRIRALNGEIMFGVRGGSQGGVSSIELIKDRLGKRDTSYNESGFVPQGIGDYRIDRVPALVTHPEYQPIVNYEVNDVAMTVLPGAPIDPETGLPTPTIAVATGGGVSVIRDDESVVNITDGTGSAAFKVQFTQEHKLAYILGEPNAGIRIDGIPDVDFTVGPNKVSRHNGEYFFLTNQVRSSGWSSVVPYLPVGSHIHPANLAVASDRLVYGVNATGEGGGLLFVYPDPNSQQRSMVAKVTKSYPTGMMVGDTKGCWLASTDASDLVGGELVTNGGFDSDVSGWTSDDGAILSQDGGRLRIENGVGSAGDALQTITTVPGATYVLSATVQAGTAGARVFANEGPRQAQVSTSSSTPQRGTSEFVAESTSTVIKLSPASTQVGSTMYADNISVRRADPDRSVNGRGLTVHGTIARTPVAGGAELVGYSSSSANNYLTSDFEGDYSGHSTFSMIAWYYGAPGSSFWSWYEAPGGGTSSEFLTAYMDIGTGAFRLLWQARLSIMQPTDATPSVGRWSQIALNFHGGSVTVYQDGRFVGTYSNIPNYDLHELRIRPSSGGKVALLRIGATAPTPEQIAKIYRDEKKLFQPGAACTLYGDSDAVTALAHDDTKGLDLVGTSDGLSRFKGLLRVSHDATPITTTIAAGAGYEVTQ